MRDVVVAIMELLLVGTNHRIAPVESRERFAVWSAELPATLAAARQTGTAIGELFVLATCNRVECYVATADVDAALDTLRAWLAEGAADGAVDAPRYVMVGEAAVAHLCRVASGLDSMIVGEAEIAGQVRRSASTAREFGTMGPYLERVVAGALRASGRARSETHIARGVQSAAAAAVALAERVVGDLGQQAVLVAGAGQAGRQVLACLSRRAVRRLFVSSRSERHVQQAARSSGAEAVLASDLAARLADVDVLIAAAQSPTALVTVAMCEASLAARAGRPQVLIDLSVPRVIEPPVSQVPGVTLYSIDDLGELVSTATATRLREVPRVEAIARDEASRAYEKVRTRATRR